MNREIKFRAFNRDIPEKGMVNPLDFMGLRFQTILNAPSVVVMQYTGLKDKNGKEIYEGDIVKLPCTRYKPKNAERAKLWHDSPREFIPLDEEWIEDIYEVVFENSSFRCKNYNPLSSWGEGKLEVIGNIYENPELTDKAEPTEVGHN